MMSPIADLLAQLRKATKPSRILDAQIEKLVVSPGCWIHQETGTAGDQGRTWHIPEYTESLDVAMTLLPERWWLRRVEGAPDGKEWWVEIEMKTKPWRRVIGQYSDLVGSPSPALAFVIAALEARQQQTSEERT